MALFDGITNLLSGLGATPQAKGYPKTLQASDFNTTSTACVSTAYIKIGEYTIPAQQMINVGFGSAVQPDNQGYIYVVSKSTANASYEGMLRVMVANANETKIVKVFEERTNVLSGSATLRTQKVPLPEKVVTADFGRVPKEDDRIQIWLKADADGTWSATYSTVYIPVTVYA